jgi:hypothetical protein
MKTVNRQFMVESRIGHSKRATVRMNWRDVNDGEAAKRLSGR